MKRLLSIIILSCIILSASSCKKTNEDLTITQYRDVTDGQAMFYTIKNDHDFIVIDGGWGGNAEQVRQVISENGNHLSAWILTHPHPDHIGAFNTIYPELGDITIDHIYATDVNADLYKTYAREWDEYPVFETFQELAKDMPNLTYLHKGDVLDIGSIHIEICNSYFDGIEYYSEDICNSSSLSFKVSGKTESMFFCGDMRGEAMCNLVISEYRDVIENCTYLQMGHHGSGSCTTDFVDIVNPKAAFFDSPKWLIESTDHDTQQNMDYLSQKGAEIYSFLTTPNEITLH